ncbi:MAG: hypothetical protein KJN90_04595 [Gammaproteobacteria bacterium]|nr:hypothetical protein [Gammaproteobacteria bacterium]
MMFYLARLEETFLSTWIRETGWVFFTSLIFHSLALALVVGVSLVILWRELGFAAGIPASRLCGLLPLASSGLAIVFVSGCMLLLAYPAKALSNPIFYLKLAAIVCALAITWRILSMNRLADPEPGRAGAHRTLACAALLLWLVSIAAGRFLAYTHSILLASSFY